MFLKASAAGVSARQERVSARYVRAARPVFRVIHATVGGFCGLRIGFCAAGRRPRPLMVESIAHFERRSHDWRGSGSKGVAEEPLRGCLNSKP